MASIENMNVKDAMQGSLSIEQLEKLKEENPTQKEVIDAKIKKEKSKQSAKTITSYLTDDELIEWSLGGFKELPNEKAREIYGEKDNLQSGGLTIQDIISGEDIQAGIDRYVQNVTPFAEKLGVDPREFSEAVLLDENQLKDFKESQSQKTELLESINKQIMLSGKDALAIEDSSGHIYVWTVR